MRRGQWGGRVVGGGARETCAPLRSAFGSGVLLRLVMAASASRQGHEKLPSLETSDRVSAWITEALVIIRQGSGFLFTRVMGFTEEPP
jgi:hypothetical protein